MRERWLGCTPWAVGAAYLSGLERRAEHQACHHRQLGPACAARSLGCDVLPSRRDTTVCSIMVDAHRCEGLAAIKRREHESKDGYGPGGGEGALQRGYVSVVQRCNLSACTPLALERAPTHGPPSAIILDRCHWT